MNRLVALRIDTLPAQHSRRPPPKLLIRPGEVQTISLGAALGRMKSLRQLELPRCGLDAKDIRKGLVQLHTLVKLDLSGNQTLDDRCLGPVIAANPGIRDLRLSETAIASLETILPLEGLEHLDVSWTNVSDSTAQALRAMRHLHFLDACNTDITCKGLVEAGAAFLRGLDVLRLAGCSNFAGVSACGMERAMGTGQRREMKRAGPRLRALSVAHSALDDRGCINFIVNFTGLASLDLSNTAIGDAAIATVSLHLRKLQFLDLSNTRITDGALMSLEGSASLRRVRLNHTRVTVKAASAAMNLASIDSLEVLELLGLELRPHEYTTAVESISQARKVREAKTTTAPEREERKYHPTRQKLYIHYGQFHESSQWTPEAPPMGISVDFFGMVWPQGRGKTTPLLLERLLPASGSSRGVTVLEAKEKDRPKHEAGERRVYSRSLMLSLGSKAAGCRWRPATVPLIPGVTLPSCAGGNVPYVAGGFFKAH